MTHGEQGSAGETGGVSVRGSEPIPKRRWREREPNVAQSNGAQRAPQNDQLFTVCSPMRAEGEKDSESEAEVGESERTLMLLSHSHRSISLSSLIIAYNTGWVGENVLARARSLARSHSFDRTAGFAGSRSITLVRTRCDRCYFTLAHTRLGKLLCT